MPLRKPILCEFVLKTIGNDIFFIELDDLHKYLDGAFDFKRYDIPLLLSKTWKLEEPVLIATKTKHCLNTAMKIESVIIVLTEVQKTGKRTI